MRVNLISRFVRELSGRGAVDNVEAVLAARASVDAEVSAFVRRVSSSRGRDAPRRARPAGRR
jgi:hypothetical protein